MRAFGQRIGERYVSLTDLKEKIKHSRLTQKDIENLYETSTGTRMRLGDISAMIDEGRLLLKEVAMTNADLYERMLERANRYARFFDEARSLTSDFEFAGILDLLKKEFMEVKQLIEFATQRTIKMKPYSENVSYEYQSDEENDFFKRILRLYALLRGSYLSKSHLLDKYLAKVETQLV